MVRTRRGKVQGSEPDQAESPALHATRAAKHRRARKTTAVSTPNGVASPVPPARARRLRSDKSSASPLQKLDETTRKRVTRSQKGTPAVAPKEDEEEYEEEDTGLFFQESFKQTKSELQKQLNGHRESLQPESNDDPITPRPELSGEQLLERIESQKRSFIENNDSPKDKTPTPADAHDDDDATPTQTNGNVIKDILSTPAPTPTPKAQDQTPRSTGWGFKSLIGRIMPSVFRSVTPSPALVAVPATAPPRPLNQIEIQELNESLVPADTPTRKPVVKQPRTSKPKRTKTASSRRIIPSQRAIISRIANNVKPEEKTHAAEWAKKQTEALAAQGSIGEKRKMLDEPMKLKDIKSIPSSLPWQTGSYGLVDDFFDDSDEECDAPEWYKLEQLANAPPAKRQRVEKENEPPVTTPKKNEAALFGVLSTSPLETPTRPATTPSPMFTNPATPQPISGNIFDQQNSQSPFDRSVVPSSFSIPDDSDEEGEPATTTSSPWTQAPPPAPAPAHASLPTPITATPSVPAMSAETFFPQADPVKDARKEAMKYTPAKPSGLRNVISQSPFQSPSGKPLANGPTSLFGSLLQAQSSLPKAEPGESVEPAQSPVKAQSSVFGFPIKETAKAPIPEAHVLDDLYTGDAELIKHMKASPKPTGSLVEANLSANPFAGFSLDSLDNLFEGDDLLMKYAASNAKPVESEPWFKEIQNSYANIAKIVTAI